MFISAFLFVLWGWYCYCYYYYYYYYYCLEEHNGIFENFVFQYLAEKGIVSPFFIAGK